MYSLHSYLLALLPGLLATTVNAAAPGPNVLPKPHGSYGVAVFAAELIDHSRLDPFAPKSSPTPRSLMVSAFYPAVDAKDCELQLTSYMPPATAAFINEQYAPFGFPNGTLGSLKMQMCKPPSTHSNPWRREEWRSTRYHPASFPLVLFSHGLTASRFLYSTMAQQLASRGYVVVTMDHPYDAAVVEYPSGKLVQGIIPVNASNETIGFDVSVRAQDVRFLLDTLGKPGQMPAPFEHGLPTDRVAMFGHSLGGDTAAAAMFNDTRIAGGLNLDGSFYGSVQQTGLGSNPYIIFSETSETVDSTWATVWPLMDGWKLQLELKNSTHNTFTDFPLIIGELLGDGPLPLSVQEEFGSLTPRTRARDIVVEYAEALAKMVLNGEPTSILQRPGAKFPEVEYSTFLH